MKDQTKQKTSKAALFFIFLCAAVYFTSYVTRINYAAVIEPMTQSTGILRENAGLVSTTAFFTYGVGQLISGFIGDKVRPRLLIVLGMSVTALCNIMMPTLTDFVPMMVLWGINGFAQAMFWPPMVRMLAENLNEHDYNRACIWVSVAASVATILIYLLAALCVEFFSWRALFYISACTAVAMAAIWQLFAPRNSLKGENTEVKREEKTETVSENEQKSSIGAAVILMMIPIASAIIVQGILRDGVTTWLPSLIYDTFELPDSLSVLMGMILPIFSMISYNVSDKIEKKIGNELVTSTVFYVTATVSAGLLALLLDVSPVISVFLLAMTTGCMHGINLMLISRIPRYFDKYGKISTVSGVVNAFTYVGSAMATYIVPKIAATWTWRITVISWVVFASVGTVVCLIAVKPWTKFKNDR